MRTLAIFLSGLLAFPAGAAFFQDPDDGEDETPPREGTFARHRYDELQRLPKEIEGAWLLMRYQPPLGVFDQNNIQGFAIFHGGYLSLTIQAQTFNAEYFGLGHQAYVQGSAHRYRFNDQLELQTAAIMGFHNLNEDEAIEFEVPTAAREYVVALSDEELLLTHRDGALLVFQRLGETEFPEQAADYLDTVRGR